MNKTLGSLWKKKVVLGCNIVDENWRTKAILQLLARAWYHGEHARMIHVFKDFTL